MASILLFHMVTPDRFHFWTDAQRNDLKTVLLTALGSSLVTDRAKQLFSGDEDDR